VVEDFLTKAKRGSARTRTAKGYIGGFRALHRRRGGESDRRRHRREYPAV